MHAISLEGTQNEIIDLIDSLLFPFLTRGNWASHRAFVRALSHEGRAFPDGTHAFIKVAPWALLSSSATQDCWKVSSRKRTTSLHNAGTSIWTPSL